MESNNEKHQINTKRKAFYKITGLYSAKMARSRKTERDFPGGAVVRDPPANAGDTGSSPGLGRSHMPRSN